MTYPKTEAEAVDFEAPGLDPEDRAHRLCHALTPILNRMGVNTTAHFDGGVPLLVRMIRAVEAQAKNRES